MEIQLSNLKDGEHIYDFISEPKIFEIDDIEFVNDILTNVILDKYGSQFNLKINISGIFNLTCERCLEKFELPFNDTFELVYKVDYKGDLINDPDNTDDDLIFIPPNQHIINIVNAVRDYLILNLPMKKTPDVKDDKCVSCGKDINQLYDIKTKQDISPVWEKLLKTKNN